MPGSNDRNAPMDDSRVIQEDVHPKTRLVLPVGLLVVAGGLLFRDLTSSNKVHELDSAPYICGLTILSALLSVHIFRSFDARDAKPNDQGWRAVTGVLLVVSAASAVGAAVLLSKWIGAQ